MINELVADQKACVESAADCKIDPDEESSTAQFGLGELLDGVADGFDKLVQQNAETEKTAIDAIGDQTNKQIDAQIAAATASATSQLVTDIADEGEIDLIKNATKLADGAEAAKEASSTGIAEAVAVARDATVVDFLNKKAEVTLEADLMDAVKIGADTDDVFAKAQPPIVLDESLITGDADLFKMPTMPEQGSISVSAPEAPKAGFMASPFSSNLSGFEMVDSFDFSGAAKGLADAFAEGF